MSIERGTTREARRRKKREGKEESGINLHALP